MVPTKPKPPETVVMRTDDTVEPRKRRQNRENWWAVIYPIVLGVAFGACCATLACAPWRNAEAQGAVAETPDDEVHVETMAVIESISRKVDALEVWGSATEEAKDPDALLAAVASEIPAEDVWAPPPPSTTLEHYEGPAWEIVRHREEEKLAQIRYHREVGQRILDKYGPPTGTKYPPVYAHGKHRGLTLEQAINVEINALSEKEEAEVTKWSVDVMEIGGGGEAKGDEQPASRGPIRWAANQWNQVGYEVNQIIAKAKRQGHVDVHVDVKGPRGEYTLLQFDLEVRLPK